MKDILKMLVWPAIVWACLIGAAYCDTCGNCAGSRMLGPGPVKFVCPICEGTGETAGPAHPAPSASAVAPKSQAAEGPAAASGLTADQQPTPMSVVGEGLRLLKLKSTDTLADLGCGFDCRWGITAARLYGCKVIAVEIDPATADSARRYVEHAGLSHLVSVVTGDATLIDVKANKAAAYLWGDVLAKLPITKYEAFVSFAHPITGGRQVGDVFVYERPAPRAVLEAFRDAQPARPVAYYGGKAYTHRVCSNPRCSMCAAIQGQLQSSRSSGRWQKVCNNSVCRYVWIPN